MNIQSFALLAATLISAHGASVTIPGTSWSTAYSGSTPVVNEVFTDSYDLSDPTGLIPGAPILVSLSLGDAILWTGGWDGIGGANLVTITFQAKVEIAAGAFGDSAVTANAIGPAPADDVVGAVGFNSFTGPADLSFVVPWGTDLSSVALTLTDQSFVTGTGVEFTQSDLNAPDSVLSTSSIPEPSTVFLLLCGGAGLGWRRKRA